ncbi:MAG: hypothetical protein ABEJ31_03110 [Haloarculaceae archaeon]
MTEDGRGSVVLPSIERLRSTVDRWVYSLSARAARALALLTITVSSLTGVVATRLMASSLVVPVAAQSNSNPQPVDLINQTVCQTPIGRLIPFGLAAISLYLIAKAVMQGTMAFNKMGSSRAQQQFEGKQALQGAGKTAAGAFVPPIFAALLTQLDVKMANCMNFGVGSIFGTVAPVNAVHTVSSAVTVVVPHLPA